MTIYKFPADFGRGKDHKKEKKRPLHHPEFIDIDDIQDDDLFFEEEDPQHTSSLAWLESVQLPPLVRIFTMGLSIALFTGSFLLLTLSTLFAITTILTLKQIPFINKNLHRYWRYCKRLFVTALGLVITVFSPPLGMGFIALYFGLQGEDVENNFIGKLFKNRN